MTINRKRVLWPALLIALLVLSALTLAAFGRLRGSRSAAEKMNASPTAYASTAKRSEYVRRSLLSPKLVWHLNALGDRLEKPGRERLIVTGTLSRAKYAQTEEVTTVWEFPERLRLTTRRGNENRVLTFDGEQGQSGANPLGIAERDLLETLVYGSAEHFFTAQMRGRATRFLASRLRLDDGSTANYDGPYYEVYKVAEQTGTSADQGEQVRLYYFNSETLLLERVSYEINRNGSTVKVEERLGDWTREQGQQVARRIERFENGESVFVLTVRTAGFSRRAEDGMFAN